MPTTHTLDEIWENMISQKKAGNLEEYHKGVAYFAHYEQSILEWLVNDFRSEMGREAFVDITDAMTIENRKLLLLEIIESGLNDRRAGICGDMLFSMTRPWIEENIEEAVRPFLTDARALTYRQLLNMLCGVNPQIRTKIALEASLSSEGKIREVGLDILAWDEESE